MIIIKNYYPSGLSSLYQQFGSTGEPHNTEELIRHLCVCCYLAGSLLGVCSVEGGVKVVFLGETGQRVCLREGVIFNTQ